MVSALNQSLSFQSGKHSCGVELDRNKYEVVNQFCYLGDIISAGGKAEASTIARVRSGWKSFRVLLPLLASRVILLKKRAFICCLRQKCYGLW